MVTRDVASAGSPPGDLCACGAIHNVPINVVVVEEGEPMQAACRVRERTWVVTALVVMDANTEESPARVVNQFAPANARQGFVFLNGAVCSRRDNVSRLEAPWQTRLIRFRRRVGRDNGPDPLRRKSRPGIRERADSRLHGRYASGVSVMEFTGMKTSFPSRAAGRHLRRASHKCWAPLRDDSGRSRRPVRQSVCTMLIGRRLTAVRRSICARG